MKAAQVKNIRRKRRKRIIRKKVFGTAERPRLTVFRSLRNTYAQIINDEAGTTICEASTQNKELRGSIKNSGNVGGAAAVGKALAERARAKKVDAVCLDRNGYRYHGRVKALADAAREGGLKF